ncbi:S-adenosylmethionine-dependent methyltransferase, YraL family [Bacteriovorax sp. BAL6_X]|uniref:16S rRNA (cytidine(1402)-2'-O)-methyltransferase n=1 Tax=Bacteriovorax sp. BAL6_X TaxID=1201290 RepID=UPI000385F904|nr:16S rRNA (cytidine(1402)-2'-O)-methyltransferase [Bacteriovorax sp. BAL6_X]EPZ50656.1 S-adenosylmethionine-dependent methyltransferase, YraL family [Bacteriovorax sp. BAL6_X]
MRLTLVTTPIGNLGDITENMRQVFASCDLVLAEDTRVFRSLLSKLEIERSNLKVVSFNDHSQDSLPYFLELIKAAQMPILVSDAGSPIISDPGHILVKELLKEGGEVTSVAGPSAVTVALELSGMAPNPFCFYGFLPRKKGEISTKFRQAYQANVTSLFFESPHRVHGTLKQLSQEFPEAQVSVCRELTKKFEECVRFYAKDFKEEMINTKGEFVLVISWPKLEGASNTTNEEIEKLAQNYLGKQTPKNLAKLLAKITNRKTQDIYQGLTSK